MMAMKPGRRALLLGAAALLAGAGASACTRREGGVASSSLLTDLRDRPLAITPPVTKLSIDDSRFLIALSLIHPDPVSLLAAWAGDVNRLSPEIYAAYLAKSPVLANLPKTPSSAAAFNVEAVLGAQPQVALVSLDSGPTDTQAAQLEQAGVRVAYIDFFQHPFENQSRSLTLLGAMTGREEQAEAYNAFRAARLKTISDRVAGLKDDQKPTVFLEAHAGNGPDCCNSVGAGNIGDYLTFVGARNIGAEVLKQPSGKLNLEFVVERDPDIYIATGGPHLEKVGGFVVGPKYDVETSRASLRRVAGRRGLSTLKAVRENRVHGLSHQLINSPIDIVATEVLARWIQPELFADLDPRATLNTINERFLAVPYRGDYWTDLVPA
ncbi:ABC transporter substrate-binding protein [Brevundimonas faecalis]|uniref:Iron complex transport system substrate-binding protein n=1 Tax=Brevundimonas faecalis TaxID=947378 RepID=A0ABV2R684_9CAUL